MKSVLTTAQYIRKALSTAQRKSLAELLDLAPSASLDDIATAAEFENLTVISIQWFLDIRAVPSTPRPLAEQLAVEFTPHEIAVIYRKLDFVLGYEPLSLRIKDIARRMTTKNYSIAYMRELCDTRREVV